MNLKKNAPGAVFLRLLPYYKPYALTLAADLFAVLAVRPFPGPAAWSYGPWWTRSFPPGTSAAWRDSRALCWPWPWSSSRPISTPSTRATPMRWQWNGISAGTSSPSSPGCRFSFFDDRKTGELMSRMSNDINKVSDAVNHVPEDVLLAAATTAGAFAVLFSLHPALALISFLPIPLAALYSGPLGGPHPGGVREGQRRRGRGERQDGVRGLRHADRPGLRPGARRDPGGSPG
ncbi:MAG: ABC transporter transmembrane domain-containing protein [Desulfobacterales bacterium]|nr:ABC transporter transmembrane domain-containing protein [Desulfobacterales bacterium]